MSEDNRTTAEILGPAKVAKLMSEARALDEVFPAVEKYAVKVGLSLPEAFERLIPVARDLFQAVEAERTTGH